VSEENQLSEENQPNEENQLTEIMMRIADMAILMNAHPLNQYADCWECEIDHRWTIAANGHREPKKWRDITVQPFHVYVEYNGFPAGIISAYEGIIAAGTEANEETFLAAIDAKIKTLEGSRQKCKS
jgi:hypothetical protein